MQPYFSIITINYNNEVGLARTLDSICNQSFKNFEIIIVDGGSTDGSRKVWKKFAFRRKTVISEDDAGIYDALNKGISNSIGKFVHFLHSGDTFANKFTLQALFEELSRENFNAVYGNNIFVSYKHDIPTVKREWYPGKHSRHKYFYGWMVPHLACTVKRDLFKKFGLFDLNYKIASDYDWQLRVYFKNGVYPSYLNHDIVHQEIGGLSNGNLLNIMKSNIEVLKAWHKNMSYVPIWLIIIKPGLKLFQLKSFFK